MKSITAVLMLASLSLFTVPTAAQPAAEGGPPVLAREIAPARGLVRLTVTSTAFRSGASLDDRYTQNGDNMSPPIAWRKGPPGTRTYVVLAEDAGVNRREPITHWVMYDIPASVTQLAEDTPDDPKLGNGAMQGLNIRKTAGFLGPKPPAGETHPYHFQVFALNKRLELDPANADRNAVVEAMKGSVLASGDIVAMYTGK